MRTFDGYMHGVNLGGWLSQNADTSETHYNQFITEADIAGQGAAVVACQLCLPQGQTLCTGHQPEKGGLGVSLHHLPGNTAFAGAGGMEHGGPVQGLQRLYSFLKSGFVDGIQGHRHGGSVLSELHV